MKFIIKEKEIPKEEKPVEQIEENNEFSKFMDNRDFKPIIVVVLALAYYFIFHRIPVGVVIIYLAYKYYEQTK